MSIDPRRTQPFPDCPCINKPCRCSRWPDYRNRWGLPVSGQTYDDQVLATGPIAYWPQSETAGLVANCLVNPLQDGTYTGVTLANDNTGPFGTPAPFYDGANDYCNIFTAAFDAAFNGAIGSVMTWAKVNGAGVWTDGNSHRVATLYDDASNSYSMQKAAANNTITGQGEAGAGVGTINHNPFSETDWFSLWLTWSDSNNADELRFYVDGIQRGATSAALNAWGGLGLNATRTLIGAQVTTPGQVWHGWLGPCAVWDRVLTPAEIAGLDL